MKIITVFGTRPEIIRLSLIIQKLDSLGIQNILLHTGQNYDPNLSGVFFKELHLRQPDYYLGVHEEAVGAQIAEIIRKSEEIILREHPDYLLILGDTNSGLAAIPAARHHITILHMEAGNRCFDWNVPEEINRKIIDHISDWLFPYTPGSQNNLLAEGIPKKYVSVSGNPITEVLRYHQANIVKSDILNKLKITSQNYFLATAHREENVDRPTVLNNIIKGFNLVANHFKKDIIFSVHPRTKRKLKSIHAMVSPRIHVHEPFGFFDFVRLEQEALCVISDSGTVQEECSIVKVPTVTIRETTERPETITCGSNRLSGTKDPKRILRTVLQMVRVRRDWVSPYERDLHVSDTMAHFIIKRKPTKRNRILPYARTPDRRNRNAR